MFHIFLHKKEPLNKVCFWSMLESFLYTSIALSALFNPILHIFPYIVQNIRKSKSIIIVLRYLQALLGKLSVLYVFSLTMRQYFIATVACYVFGWRMKRSLFFQYFLETPFILFKFVSTGQTNFQHLEFITVNIIFMTWYRLGFIWVWAVWLHNF